MSLEMVLVLAGAAFAGSVVGSLLTVKAVVANIRRRPLTVYTKASPPSRTP